MRIGISTAATAMITMTIMTKNTRIIGNLIFMILKMTKTLLVILILTIITQATFIAIAVSTAPSVSFAHKIPLRRLKSQSSRRFEWPHGQTWRLFSMNWIYLWRMVVPMWLQMSKRMGGVRKRKERSGGNDTIATTITAIIGIGEWWFTEEECWRVWRARK